jgi:hypothetical protein
VAIAGAADAASTETPTLLDDMGGLVGGGVQRGGSEADGVARRRPGADGGAGVGQAADKRGRRPDDAANARSSR